MIFRIKGYRKDIKEKWCEINCTPEAYSVEIVVDKKGSTVKEE